MEEIQGEVRLFAARIYRDVNASMDLDAQRALLHLGGLLRTPLPLSTSENESKVELMTQMLRFEGDTGEFPAVLSSSLAGSQQQKYAIGVSQASGSGKTKLAYLTGTTSAYVIFVRIALQFQSKLAPPWELWLQFNEKTEKDVSSQQLRAKLSFSAMKLLIYCYVEYVAMILESLIAASPEIADSFKQEAALRALRNATGEAFVCRLFQYHLASIFGTPSCDVDVAELSEEGLSRLDAHATSLKLRMGALTAGKDVCIFYDEVQQLMERGKCHFSSLMCMLPDLIDEMSWQQVYCGSCLDITDGIHASDRIQTEHHASFITPMLMQSSLQHYFALEDAFFEDEEVAAALARLSGRPKFFFDFVFLPLVAACLEATKKVTCLDAMKETTCLEAVEQVSVEFIRQHILTAADIAISKRREFFNRLWRDHTLSRSDLCNTLYFLLKMGNGDMDASILDPKQVVGLGVLPYHPKKRANVNQEWMTAHALEEEGDARVATSQDPVLAHLNVRLKSSVGTGLEDDLKNKVQEQLLCWHVIKTNILTRKEGWNTLKTIFAPLMVHEFPDGLRGRMVTCTRALPEKLALESVSPPAKSVFDYLCNYKSADDVLVYALDEAAGANVAFTTHHEGLRFLCLAHCKVEADAQIADILRAASPAWQYTSEKQRERVVAGEPCDASEIFNNNGNARAWTDSRLQFVELWGAHPTFFTEATRIAFCLGGYKPGCKDVIERANRAMDSHILACRSDSYFAGLSDTLKHLTPGYSVSATDDVTFVWPQSAEFVQLSNIRRDEIPAVTDEA